MLRITLGLKHRAPPYIFVKVPNGIFLKTQFLLPFSNAIPLVCTEAHPLINIIRMAIPITSSLNTLNRKGKL